MSDKVKISARIPLKLKEMIEQRASDEDIKFSEALRRILQDQKMEVPA